MLMNARSLTGCKNMGDLNELLLFGYKLTLGDIYNSHTWIDFEQPLLLLKFIRTKYNSLYLIDDERFKLVWNGILSNKILSDKDKNYWIEICIAANCKRFINYGGDQSPFRYCVMYQSNVEMIKFLVENYNANKSLTQRMMGDAMKYNTTENAIHIVIYLQSLYFIDPNE